MNLINFIQKFFGKSESGNKAPLVIINKDQEIIEYDSIETALADLETDPDIPKHKMEKIRASFEELKNKGKIRIKNGEIVK
ncbi:MAG: hypothetical protein JST15_09925 [Bacteroidetes bacterium]|nr:hypothetical protein [Bacteroidota bacterium]